MKCKWNGDNKLCIPTLESGKVMPGGVFEMDPESQKLAGVQKLMRDGLIVPCPEAPAAAPAAPPEAPKGPEVKPPVEVPEGEAGAEVKAEKPAPPKRETTVKRNK